MKRINPIRRIKRKEGLTINAIHYRKENNKDNKEIHLNKIKEIILNQYIDEGFGLNGKIVSTEDIALRLRMDEDEVLNKLNTLLERRNPFFKDTNSIAHSTRELQKRLFFSGLETYHLAQHQAQLMFQSQGGTYMPFISDAANKAISNMIAAQKPMQELMKTLADQGHQQTLIQINTQVNQQETRTFITVEEAMKIAENMAQPSMLQDPSQVGPTIMALPEPLPEVRAKFQDLNKIGIRYDGTKALDEAQPIPNTDPETLPE